MSHPLRMYEANRVYELTMRTIHGRYLLVPSPASNELVLGVIGRAQHHWPSVNIHAFVALSNHFTWLVSSPTPNDLSAFMGFVHGNISKEIGKLHDWPGAMWERRFRAIPVLDDESQVARMRYLLAQGCKEDLVESPRDWPGVSTVHALERQGAIEGVWYDRESETRARRHSRQPPSPDRFAIRHQIQLSKLPCWAHLSDESYAAAIREQVDSLISEHGQRRRREGRRVLGVHAICAAHPHTRPDDLPRSPAVACHATTRALRVAFANVYRLFRVACRTAADAIRSGYVHVEFPPYAYPPRASAVAPAEPITFAFETMSWLPLTAAVF